MSNSRTSKRSRDGSLRGDKKLKKRNSMIQSILEEDDDHSQDRSAARVVKRLDGSDEKKQDLSRSRGKD